MSKKLVEQWRLDHPTLSDNVLNRQFIFTALEPATLSTYKSSAAAYIQLFGEDSFPVSGEKLVTFIRFRSDLLLNSSTTKSYVYNICSYNCYLGFPKLLDEDRTLVDKALRAAMKVSAPPSVVRAPTFDVNELRKILDHEEQPGVGSLFKVGLSLALRMKDISNLTASAISPGRVFEKFCIQVTFPHRKNYLSPTVEQLYCIEWDSEPCGKCNVCSLWLFSKQVPASFYLCSKNQKPASHDQLVRSFQELAFRAGVSRVETLKGHSLRRSALQAYELLGVDPILIHSIAGWVYKPSPQAPKYLDDSLVILKRHMMRVLSGKLKFNEVKLLEIGRIHPDVQ
jgi:hypothetical protein